MKAVVVSITMMRAMVRAMMMVVIWMMLRIAMTA